jgi:phosphatidylglycerophosphate synthase
MAVALELPGVFLVQVLALYAGQAALILRATPPELPGPGLGPANRITLLRSTLALPVGALALSQGGGGEAVAWTAIGLSTVSLALDGVDGKVARATGTSTPFGARYDMELDAFLMLGLSVLIWQTGRAGPWVVLIGTLRYLFVAAGWIWPRLRAPLFPSFRRKLVCVVQGVTLVVALGPPVPVGPARILLACALLLLAGSFVVDTAWLARGGDLRPGPPGG